MSAAPASTRLARLARQGGGGEREAVLERCELCGTPIGPEHRHLLDLETRDPVCACRACALLFDRDGAGGRRMRAIPDRRLRLDDLQLDDVMWEELRLPVDIAFVLRTDGEQRVQAFYPSPMGATESLLRLEAWDDLVVANPILATLEPEVEALLVDRARGARRHWLVPINECFALVGLIRMRWRGLTGGKEVWQELGRFFDGLDARSRPASRNDTKEATWRR
jgi:hypothetical protein